MPYRRIRNNIYKITPWQWIAIALIHTSSKSQILEINSKHKYCTTGNLCSYVSSIYLQKNGENKIYVV